MLHRAAVKTYATYYINNIQFSLIDFVPNKETFLHC